MLKIYIPHSKRWGSIKCHRTSFDDGIYEAVPDRDDKAFKGIYHL